MSACRKTVGVYQGQFKLRGNMGEKWPKIDHIPPHFYFWAHILSHFWAPGVVSPQVSVYWILVPCRGASVWDHADICPPGIYFSSLPRSRTRNHRTRIHFLSYSPLLRANNLHIAQVPVERHTSQRSWVSDTIAIHHKWLPTSLNGASSQH